ncbi:MAG: class I SAM-dependent methyltransferase [Candidatus Sericytochromatia bacterium]|nr:class I SAM-dependent methyltransferase [Candidatus Sericytochromatia bacterium]
MSVSDDLIAQWHRDLARHRPLAEVLAAGLQSVGKRALAPTNAADSALQHELLWLLSELPRQAKLPEMARQQALALLRVALPRQQNELQPWAQVALRLLLTSTEASTVLQVPQMLPSSVPLLFQDPLFLLLLQQSCLTDPQLELALRDWRALLLQAPECSVCWQPFAFALAHQLWNNGYLYATFEAEAALLARISQQLRVPPPSDAQFSDRVLRCALYSDLGSLRLSDLSLAVLLKTGPSWVRLLQKLIFDRRQEDRLARQIPVVTPLPAADLCQSFYAAYPYPRWLAAPVPPESSQAEMLQGLFPHHNWAPHFSGQPRWLIAGCGTGRQVLAAAQACPQARLTACDLSQPSLAYAARMLQGFALTRDVALVQADLLTLAQQPGWSEAFDGVACGGVLHHLADPFAGLQQLVAVLRPGGLLRLGVYSQTARQTLRLPPPPAARQDDAALCSWRWHWLQSHADQAQEPLLQIQDFYQLGHCRDLLLHPREQPLTLPRLADWFAALQLQLLGLELWDPRAYKLYSHHFPQDPTRCYLPYWHQLEQAYPHLFVQMYIFWLRRSA